MAYHFDAGAIRGIDISGLTLASVVFIPGNILAGNWQQVLFVDEQANDEQAQAIVDAFTGKLGGPLADLAQLVGERLEVVPAWVGKAERFVVNMPEHDWTYEFTGRNAIQSNWMIDYPRRGGLSPPVASVASAPFARVPGPILAAVAAAWGAAIAAEASGIAASLHHDSLLEGGLGVGPALLFFLVSWQVMIAAMMLPSSLPLVRMFAAASAGAPDRRSALGAFLGAYALVWSAFSLLAFGATPRCTRRSRGAPGSRDTTGSLPARSR